MCQRRLFSLVSLAINSNKNPDIKFSYIYSRLKTLSENPLKHFPFSFHLAGALYQAIIYPATVNWKVMQVGEDGCYFCLLIISIRTDYCFLFSAQIRLWSCESYSGLLGDR